RALSPPCVQGIAAEIRDARRGRAVVAYADEGLAFRLRRPFGAPWCFEPQGEGDLGARLGRFFEWSRANGVDLLVAGSDAPTLAKDDIAAAFAALAEGAEVVFAPSPDGGFSLVGVAARRGEPGDFLEGVRWSTASALEDARRAAERRGLRVQILAPVPDVDELGDLTSLVLLLSSPSKKSSRSSSSCPATRRALAALRLAVPA